MEKNLEHHYTPQVWHDIYNCSAEGGHSFQIRVDDISSPFVDHVSCPIHGVFYQARFVKREGHNPMAYLNSTGPGVHW